MNDSKSRVDWRDTLRTFRQRNGLKQEAAASLLGVSQAYVSRVENGGMRPSKAVIQRMQLLASQPEHRPVLELLRRTIRHCPALSTLLRREGGRIIVDEHSRAFYRAGAPFDDHKRGEAVKGSLIGDEALEIIHNLDQVGAFDGRIGLAEVVWSTGEELCCGSRHFRTILTPLRGDDADWRLHAVLTEIDAKAKARAVETWGASLRLFGHDEELPFDWP